MILLYVFLYVVIGAVITFMLYYLNLKNRTYPESVDVGDYIFVGVLWPALSPFAFAVYLAKKLNERL